MGSRQNALSSPPPGAARGWELRWPDYGVALTDNATPGTGSTGRGGGSSSAGWTNTAGGTGAVRLKNNQPGVGAGSAVGQLGAVSVEYVTAAGGDLAKTQGPGASGVLMQLPAGVPAEPFERVYRFCVLAAFPALAGAIAAGADLGLELLPGNVASMNNGANRPGIMFGPTDANKIGLRTRGSFGAAYASDQELTLAQLGLASTNQWMLWELRIVFGDANGPAQLKAFINGKQFGAAVVWDQAGAILPNYISAGGGFYGLFPFIISSNVAAGYLCYAQYARVIRAPDENNL